MEYIRISDINLDDDFFNSLRDEYFNFDKWFIKEKMNGSSAYVTYKNNNISSFMMWKLENDEDYSDFSFKFQKCTKLKIQSFKVADVGIGIGTKFLEIINEEAIKNNVSLIYITLFPNHEDLAKFLIHKGFVEHGFKFTKRPNGRTSQELVFIKRIVD